MRVAAGSWECCEGWVCEWLVALRVLGARGTVREVNGWVVGAASIYTGSLASQVQCFCQKLSGVREWVVLPLRIFKQDDEGRAAARAMRSIDGRLIAAGQDLPSQTPGGP